VRDQCRCRRCKALDRYLEKFATDDDPPKAVSQRLSADACKNAISE
jgi:hypothetical protein